MKKVVAIIGAISEWSGKTVSFLITILALMVGVEVVARYVFNHPTEWSQELSAMVFGTFSVLGGAYTLRTNGHVNMDIIYQILPLRFRASIADRHKNRSYIHPRCVPRQRKYHRSGAVYNPEAGRRHSYEIPNRIIGSMLWACHP